MQRVPGTAEDMSDLPAWPLVLVTVNRVASVKKTEYSWYFPVLGVNAGAQTTCQSRLRVLWERK